MRYVIERTDGCDIHKDLLLARTCQAKWGGTLFELGPEVKELDVAALIKALQKIRNRGGCGCVPNYTCPQHVAAEALKAAGIE